jgi:hypothetical protein
MPIFERLLDEALYGFETTEGSSEIDQVIRAVDLDTSADFDFNNKSFQRILKNVFEGDPPDPEEFWEMLGGSEQSPYLVAKIRHQLHQFRPAPKAALSVDEIEDAIINERPLPEDWWRPYAGRPKGPLSQIYDYEIKCPRCSKAHYKDTTQTEYPELIFCFDCESDLEQKRDRISKTGRSTTQPTLSRNTRRAKFQKATVKTGFGQKLKGLAAKVGRNPQWDPKYGYRVELDCPSCKKVHKRYSSDLNSPKIGKKFLDCARCLEKKRKMKRRP